MEEAPHCITRRNALLGAAAFGAGVAADHITGGAWPTDEGSVEGRPQGASVPFYGLQQAGIATPAPEFVCFAAFDVASDSVDDLRALLQEWTALAAALTRGKAYQPSATSPKAAPVNPGEALGLGPESLTITIGLGPTLFGSGGKDRFGFGSRRPPALVPLPSFSGESLDPRRSDGDLCIQACAENPQVAFHAIHTLTLIASGIANLRWSQDGFGRTSSTSASQPTPRNLMGFKDGTNNVRSEDTKAMDKFVWVQPGDGSTWMVNGSYLIMRRIKILFDVWDATSLEGQEEIIGRRKQSGAPLEGTDEFDPVPLDASHGGQPVIPTDAHIRLSSPKANGGRRILRRGFSFSEPAEPGSGQIDAGLFFVSFQRDPEQFTLIQRRLSNSDALNRHILHTASAIFACPPGVRHGGFVGEGLFG